MQSQKIICPSNVSPCGLMNNKWTLFQVMAWHRRISGPLSESIMARFAYTRMQHQAPMCSLLRCRISHDNIGSLKMSCTKERGRERER